MQKIDKLVPDTSVIIDGLVSLKINKKEIEVGEIIIHEAVLAELEHQANIGKAVGFVGLDELKKIKELADKKIFNLRFGGKRPISSEIRRAGFGEIDAMIRQLAWEEDAFLFTADKVQARVGEARGLKLLFIPKEEGVRELKLESYFDSETMSVHLKENVKPYAKKGMPGNWKFMALSDKKSEQDEIKDISREVIEEARIRADGFIEIERKGSTIIQLGMYRIVITRPPLADGWEITAVRAVKKLNLEDYKLSQKLKDRIAEQGEGILIAGAPGMGKTTFAQALSEYYAEKNKIVKTVEAPRDLVLPEAITQYAISHGSAQEIHDILLLSRPDYAIFDEMRNTADFKLFADLRLAGIGFVGVVHATNPIDAIQRFVGRIELGVIPQIIDTVIFIKNGKVHNVLNLKITVKVPTGMTEADLARPVIVVEDFETGKLEFELYSYGEQTVVVPVIEEEKKGVLNLASKEIEREFQKYSDIVKADVISANKAIVYVQPRSIPAIIGKQGKNIEKIEKKVGISIDVRELKEATKKTTIPYEVQISKKSISFLLNNNWANRNVDLAVEGEYILTANVSKKGVIKIKTTSKTGKELVNAINSGQKVELIG